MMVKRSVVDIKAVIGEMVEPLPDEELLKKLPEHKDLLHNRGLQKNNYRR